MRNMNISPNLTAFLILACLIMIFPAITAAQCIVPGDQEPCDKAVNITELMVYIGDWYKCSACVPDIFQAIQAYYGIPFCGDAKCNGDENCSTCEADCCPFPFCVNVTGCVGYDIGNCTSPDPCNVSPTGCEWNSTTLACQEIPGTCGNGSIDGTEACDGPDLGGATCAGFGYDTGNLSCCPGCQDFDLTYCWNITYGACTDNDAADYYTASDIDYSFSFVPGPPCPGDPAAGPGGGAATDYDSCNGTVLTERICSGADPSYIEYDCGTEGMVCQNGACVSISSIELTSCQTLDAAGGYYYMDQDIFQPLDEDCLIIDAENVTLDCKGHSLNTSSTTGITGILAHGANTTIKNCNVNVGWGNGMRGTGIRLYYANGSRAVNNTVCGHYEGILLTNMLDGVVEGNTVINNSRGIHLNRDLQKSNSSNNTVIGNSVSGSLHAGIWLDGSNVNDILNNHLSFNDKGIRTAQSNYNSIIGNVVVNSTYSGISTGWFGNRVINNTVVNTTSFAVMISGFDTVVSGNDIRGGSRGMWISSNSGRNKITGNNITRAFQGIYLEFSSHNVFTGNNASHNYDGIRILPWMTLDSVNNTLINNIANDNFQYGIYLVRSWDSHLTGNEASGNSDGFYLDECSNNNLTGNTASNNFYGIYLTSSTGNTLSGNTVFNNSQHGIYLAFGSDDCVLTDNNGSHNANGILMNPSSNSHVAGNVLHNNKWGGIYLGGSSNNVIEDNNAYGNNYGIRLYQGSQSNTVRNNVVSYNSQYGIYLLSPVADGNNNNDIYGNNASNSQIGIGLISSSFSTISNNNLSNNWVGIRLTSSNGNTFSGNVARDNTQYGFYVDSATSSNNNVDGNEFCSNPEDVYCLNNQTFTNNVCDSGDVCGGSCSSCP